ncbi:hypothetical protein EV363DRAFT_1271670 [Boletus edulis]|nr:hypothetical protein EV363DRAFT_1271670 [Boletus edulis]
MSLVRVPLTLTAALAFHVSMSPPSTPHTDMPEDKRTACVTARIITTILTKGLFWTSALTDMLVVLTPHLPTSLPTVPPISIPPTETLLAWIKHPTLWSPGLALALKLPTPLAFPPLPLVTIAGTALALTGAYLRYTSYHALGQFYACPNRGEGPCVPRVARSGRGHAHALITTGPYAYVRHPGYAGLVLCTAGLVILHLDALKTGGGEGIGRIGVSVGTRTVALVCTMLGTVGTIRRMQDEERSLRARFKGEWEAWAQRVPYKFVPGVY